MNFKSTLKKAFIALMVTCIVFGIAWLLSFLLGYSNHHTFRLIDLAKSILPFLIFYVSPAIASIVVLEFLKCKRALHYMISSSISLLLFLLSICIFFEIIDPFLDNLKSTKVRTHYGFTGFKSNPSQAIPYNASFIRISIFGSIIGAVYSWIYWFLAVKENAQK